MFSGSLHPTTPKNAQSTRSWHANVCRVPLTGFIRFAEERLDAHQSWTKLLIAFIRDRRVRLFSRAVWPLQ